MSEDDLRSIAQELANKTEWWPETSTIEWRGWRDIIESEDFEAWIIAWPPGGAIELHDHGHASGAIVVKSGELVEKVVAHHHDGSVEIMTKIIGPRESVTFSADHVHDIVNQGTTAALSVHVYAPRLTEMTFYEVVEDQLEIGRTIRYGIAASIP